MALILVIFVISLMTIIVINLTYSASLGATQSANVQRTIQAEYLLKSAVNFARVLLRADTTPDEDSGKDLWGTFANGAPVPLELLGLSSTQNVKSIELEIRPEDSKIPLAALVPAGSSTPSTFWPNVLTQLFRNLNFDDDGEEDQTGIFPNRHFRSDELVGILIDYMDSNKVSYNPGGIESDLPEDQKELFPNRPIERIGELSAIPGFTPKRLQRLVPLISAVSGLGSLAATININLAPSAVIRSLNQNIDEQMTQAIVAFRTSEEGPFTNQNSTQKMTDILGDPDVWTNIRPNLGYNSKWFQVIAKVDYGTASYFVRAYLSRPSGNAGELPEIQSFELF